MSAAGPLLALLEHVKQTGPGRWMARCPAHNDRGPSLSIRETNDRILIHCFAGCGAADVMRSVGLTLAHLYPDGALAHRIPPLAGMKRDDRRFYYETILMLAEGDRQAGRRLSPEDLAIERDAWQRLHRG